MKREGEGKSELSHVPVPGYPTLFYAVFGIAAVYLAVMLAF